MNLKIKAAILAAALAAVAFVAPVKAQTGGGLYPKTSAPWFQQGKISGGVAVTSSSARTALPAAGFQAWVCNTGSIDAYLAFGGSTITASATTSSWLKAGTCGNYDLWPTAAVFTNIAAITASGTTTLTVETGAGVGPSQTPGSSSSSPIITSAVSTNINVSITPTIAASSHASGSSAGGLQTVTFFRASSTFSGILNNVKWTWKTGANLTAVTLYIFSANPTGSTCTDAVAFSLAAADVSKQIAGSPFTLTPTVIGSGATISTAYQQSPISMRNADGTPGVNLYACVVANATVTPAANDGVLNLAGITD